MIKRLVRLEFQAAKVRDFQQLFEEVAVHIRSFPGCLHLELWKECGKEHVFYTYSLWENQKALDKYRFSPLFKATWEKTKSYFLVPAIATNLEMVWPSVDLKH